MREQLRSQVPIRTCVGCRSRDEQPRLVRVVMVVGRPTLDPKRRLPGRGAYVHPSRECVDRAAGRRGFNRAFRTSVPSEDARALWGALESRGSRGFRSPAEMVSKRSS